MTKKGYERFKNLLKEQYTNEELAELVHCAEALNKDNPYEALSKLNQNLNLVKLWLKESKNFVFFGGAGVSTASGVPDFRSENGLYKKDKKRNPEDVLDPYYMQKYPKRFYTYFKENFLAFTPKPNNTHKILAELEAQGKLKAVVTQNVDGLHQEAGSKNVYELHGTLKKYRCLRHQHSFDYKEVDFEADYPKCPTCKSLLRPNMTLYHELLNWNTFTKAQVAVDSADLLIVAGTSLTVEPAASMAKSYYVPGKNHSVYIDESAVEPNPYFEVTLPLNLNMVMEYITRKD